MQTQDRLESWKAISAHLNRTVRTVQRWERDLGLPVHRIPGRKRDMVYALAGELDQWVRTREGARALAEPVEPDFGEHATVSFDQQNGAALAPLHRPQAPEAGLVAEPSANAAEMSKVPAVPHTTWRRMAATTIALLLFGGAAALGLRERARSLVARLGSPEPHDWKVTPQQFEAYDARGRLLWSYPFKDRLYPAPYERSRRVREPALVAIHDLDGDGRKEVMFVTRFEDPRADDSTFYVLNSDGTVRFTHARREGMRFGKLEYHPPFYPRGFMITSDPDGTSKIWLSIPQQPEFPEVLIKLDDKGRVLSQFWHGGHLHGLAEGTYRGKRVIFSGYVENDKRRASMAVLDYDHANGSAPAEDSYYECTSCSPQRPLEFFIFPRSEISRILNSMPLVEAFYTKGGGLQVATRQNQEHHLGPNLRGGTFYKFNEQLEIIDAFHDASYPEVHAALEARGVIKHAYSRAEELEAFPVLKWNGSRFVPVPAPADFVKARRQPTALYPPHQAAAPRPVTDPPLAVPIRSQPYASSK